MQDFEKGQILLIVVLVMVTALTIALSVAARSITNTRTSEEAASSEQAFSAAEAGIEKSLTNNASESGTLANSASYKATLLTVGGQEFSLNNGSPVLKDEPVDLWLSTYPDYSGQRTGNITVYWGKSGDTCNSDESQNTAAALEIIIFSGSINTPQTNQYALDPCSSPPTDRSNQNNFQTNITSNPSYKPAGVKYNYSYTFNVSSGLFVRIVPLYAPTIIGVTGCNAANGACKPFPTQGTLIQSLGKALNTEREIQTYNYNPQLPAELMQYSFFVPQ